MVLATVYLVISVLILTGGYDKLGVLNAVLGISWLILGLFRRKVSREVDAMNALSEE